MAKNCINLGYRRVKIHVMPNPTQANTIRLSQSVFEKIEGPFCVTGRMIFRDGIHLFTQRTDAPFYGQMSQHDTLTLYGELLVSP